MAEPVPPFATLLRRHRQAAGLTQEALAERAHLSARSISDLERGINQHPRSDTLALLAGALALSPEERAQLEWSVQHQPGPAVPPPALPAHPTNLPLALTSFIGREREQAAIERLLQETRLLTLTGAGGCGKTRLALQVAGALLGDYQDGVWLVEMAPLADPALVPQAVAAALGVREDPGRPLLATLADTLRSKRLLLVLDNCEHLVLACAVLATALLQTCSQVQILATSREALGITGERAWKVPSLSLPGAAHQPSPVAALLDAEAVRLFVERAQAARPAFALTAQNCELVAQMCRRLDGIPLALELAAARLSALTVEDLAARLDDRFRLLTGGSRTALPRQQTLRATLDWSHGLLSEGERALLRWLTVFAGGWTLDAAEAVCAGVATAVDRPGPDAAANPLGGPRGEGIATAEVLDLLAGLVNKSLVVLDEGRDLAGREGRYRLLETVRQYAAERLADSAEAAGVREQHLSWCVALAERAEPELEGREQVGWLVRLELELDNLRGALRWAQETGQAARGLRLAGALGRFWDKHSHRAEGRRWLEGFLALSSGGSAEGTILQAHALNWAARLASLQMDTREAEKLADQSVALYRGLGDPAGLAAALCTRGEVAGQEADVVLAVALLDESLALRRGLGDKLGMADSLQILAEVERFHNPERALALGQECLALYQELGHPWDIAGTTFSMGMAAGEHGDLERAQSLGEESLALFRELGDKRGIASALFLLTRVTWEQGDLGRALALSEESLAVARDLGDSGIIGWQLLALGVVVHSQGNLERAGAVLAESLALFWTVGLKLGVGYCLSGLATVAGGQGQAQRAARLAGATDAFFARPGLPLARRVRGMHDRTVAATRTVLGEDVFAVAWTSGQALPLEQTVAEALATLPPTSQ
jgi:non-specific serine/threonine protein kinase